MKPCPFCGSFNTKVAGEYGNYNGDGEVFHIIFVECQEEGCKAKGPGVGGFGKEGTNEEIQEAFRKWQKRTE